MQQIEKILKNDIRKTGAGLIRRHKVTVILNFYYWVLFIFGAKLFFWITSRSFSLVLYQFWNMM